MTTQIINNIDQTIIDPVSGSSGSGSAHTAAALVQQAAAANQALIAAQADITAAYESLLGDLVGVAYSSSDPNSILMFLNDLTALPDAVLSSSKIKDLLQKYSSYLAPMITSMFYLTSFNSTDGGSSWLTQAQTRFGRVDTLAGTAFGSTLTSLQGGFSAFMQKTTAFDGTRVWPAAVTGSNPITYSWNQYNAVIAILIANGQAPNGTINANPYTNLLGTILPEYKQYFDAKIDAVKDPARAFVTFTQAYDGLYTRETRGLALTTNILSSAADGIATPLAKMLEAIGNGTITIDQAKEFVTLFAMVQDLSKSSPQMSGILDSLNQSIAQIKAIPLTSGGTLGALLDQAIQTGGFNDGRAGPGYTYAPISYADAVTKYGIDEVELAGFNIVPQPHIFFIPGQGYFEKGITAETVKYPNINDIYNSLKTLGVNQALISGIQQIGALFTSQSNVVATSLNAATKMMEAVLNLGSSVSGRKSAYQKMIQNMLDQQIKGGASSN